MRVDVLVMAGRKEMFWLSGYCLLAKAIHLALRSNMQRRVDVGWAGQTPMLQGVVATPIKVMGDAQVGDQSPAARLVS